MTLLQLLLTLGSWHKVTVYNKGGLLSEDYAQTILTYIGVYNNYRDLTGGEIVTLVQPRVHIEDVSDPNSIEELYLYIEVESEDFREE